MTSEKSHHFQGWMVYNPESIGNMQWQEFEPKPWEEDDVDIRVTYCGMCGSGLSYIEK